MKRNSFSVARALLVRRLAEVGLEQLRLLVVVELVVDREVAEVEPAVAHPRVLPVDQLDALAVAQEVRGQQVVVGRHRLVAGLVR